MRPSIVQPTQLADSTYRGDLGNGLILRWSTVDDQAKIAQCLGTVFRPSADAPLNVRAMDETRIMMRTNYPFMGPGDFALVEDASHPDCPVVACTCYWRHTWSHGGIPFGVGRSEMVATLPAYRNRGLVRALFEMFQQIGLFGRLTMIVDAEGAVCGYVLLLTRRRSKTLWVFALQLYPHVSWPAVMPALLRALRVHGEQTPAIVPDAKPFSEIGFNLGRAHPAYRAMGETLAPRYEQPYAWYLRVADTPGFIRHVAPVLEQRLAQSIMPGHTGELVIDFYRGGLRLDFAQGKLAAVEPWRAPEYGDDPPAGCPALVFLQLLFGYRSLAELRATFPDVYAESEAALLLDILFSKQPSTLHSLGYT